MKDAGGNVTKYAYDGFDRLSATYFPDKETKGQWSTTDYEAYTYDANGNMLTKRTRSAQTITYTYDALNRLTQRVVPGARGGGIFTFEYDLAGRRTRAVNGNITQDWRYDALGRLEQQTTNGVMPVTYDYDEASNIEKLTYPDGWAVDFEYDALNRVTAAKRGSRVYVGVGYDPLSRRQSVTYANGTSASYDYTKRGDLTTHNWSKPGGNPLAHYTMAYNGVGQLLSETISDPTLEWTPAVAKATDFYEANGLNQYKAINGATVDYDGNGNMVRDLKGRKFTYDAENMLQRVDPAGGGSIIAEYIYNPDGSRHYKRSHGLSGEQLHFYHVGDQELLETANNAGWTLQNNTVLRRYIRLPSSVDEANVMIDYTANGSCLNANDQACEAYAHFNRQGSVIATTDQNGTVQDTYTYSPYGVSGASNTGFPFRFTGQRLDPETGLYYYKARYYDQETGRFLQADPIGFEDQQNLYAYVGNDPINAIDPSGQKAIRSCSHSDTKGKNPDGTSCDTTAVVKSAKDGNREEKNKAIRRRNRERDKAHAEIRRRRSAESRRHQNQKNLIAVAGVGAGAGAALATCPSTIIVCAIITSSAVTATTITLNELEEKRNMEENSEIDDAEEEITPYEEEIPEDE